MQRVDQLFSKEIMASSKVTGGCLCGGVQYEYVGKPTFMVHCHCTMCRRAIGASYSTTVRVQASNFKLLKQNSLKSYASSQNGVRQFCGNCGANIVDKVYADKDYLYVLAGTITGNPGTNIQAHIFTNYKAPWITLNDGAPSSGEMELLTQLVEQKK